MRRREKQEARHRLARTVGMFVCLLVLLVIYLYMSLTWSRSPNLPVDTNTSTIEKKANKFALRMKKPRGEPNFLHAEVVRSRAEKRQKKQLRREKGLPENEEVMLDIAYLFSFFSSFRTKYQMFHSYDN